ncbi:hypothetical protein [Adlercreutzia sp. ZJ154]|uniref:hypothetical protein n=1 Tax=Adlercreutzia sp. ZJ154 TaxID=2709790 RepID=UPI0013EE3C5E|nr:hypothetical protein [Adlercreutzia sp. ZJ154]
MTNRDQHNPIFRDDTYQQQANANRVRTYGMNERAVPPNAPNALTAPYAPNAAQTQAQAQYAQYAAAQPGYSSNTYRPPVTSQPSQASKRKRGAGFWIGIVVAILALIAAAILAYFMLFSGDGRGARSGTAGQLEGKTPEEVQAEIDRVVEEGMFNISIASVVEFQDGTSEGEFKIENVPNNPYLMRVVITREDTGEQVYETGIIEQNFHIQSDKLDVDLAKGQYPCVATFYALDPETEEEVGSAAAQITINVLG